MRLPQRPRNLFNSSINVFTAKSSRIRPSFLARVTILDAHTIGSQCLLGLGNLAFRLWNMTNSFSSSKPVSTKCSNVGKRFFTRGETIASTSVKQTHTYLERNGTFLQKLCYILLFEVNFKDRHYSFVCCYRKYLTMVRRINRPLSSFPCIVADTKTAIESGHGITIYWFHHLVITILT